MINKKIVTIAVVLCICCLFGVSFSENNFITIAGGGGTRNLNTTTLGQAIVFAQQTDRYIVKSGYASIIMSSKSSDITFEDQTEKITFESQVVPIKVKVTTSKGTIDQVAYKVGNGANPDFNKISSVEYTNFEPNQTQIVFDKNIDFAEGQSVNQFWLWAQYKDESGSVDSSYIIITINTKGGISSDVTIESPDPLTKLSSLDPKIVTSKFSIDVSSVKVSLYEENSIEPLYEVSASSTSDTYEIFDSTNSCISYLNSDIMRKYGLSKTTLTENKEYTLNIDFDNKYEDIVFTFKAIGNGVGNILTYPSPFNPNKEKIKIRYLLAQDSRVTIKLYDKAGKIVSKLIQSESRSAGTNEEEWDGRSYSGDTLATGAYIVEIIAKSSSGENRRYTALAIVGK